MNRPLLSALVFCMAGMTMAFAMIVTALVGVLDGSTGPVVPTAFVVLFWAVCGVIGIPAGVFARWVATRQ